MKAVIMAGGKGARLFPISAGFPKPLAPVLGKPVIDHIVELLDRHGIKEAIATLQYMPEMIINHFEEQLDSPVDISFAVEKEPRGTAGSVGDCAGFLGRDDFIVISGDALCDFDLTACMDFHRSKNADVTIVLYKHPSPLEYGLVMTNSDGKIERFIEKPSWKQVFCDTVNTGVYIINPRVLDKISRDKPFDFAKDLFPMLLEEGYGLYGYTCDGYWKDIGDPAAYLECHLDLLDGKANLPYCNAKVTHVTNENKSYLIPPVSIGDNVFIGKGSVIGPFAVIGEGSRIGENVVVTSSVINGGTVHDGAEVSNSILCAGSSVGRDAVLADGCVLGEGSRVEAGASLSPCVVLSPNERVSRGRHITSALRSDALPLNDEGKILSDSFELTAQYCLRLGEALASLGGVAVGYGDMEAEVFAQAIMCGVRYGGADVYRHDARFLAEASFIAASCGANVSAYVTLDGSGSPEVCVLGRHGALLSREDERKLLWAMRQGGEGKKRGGEKFILGAPSLYEDTIHCYKGKLDLVIAGDSVETEVLGSILEHSGVTLRDEEHSDIFSIVDGKLRITASGREALSEETILALLTKVCMEETKGALLLPFSAPDAIRELAMRLGGKVYIEGKNVVNEEMQKTGVIFRDPIRGAVAICDYMLKTGKSVAEIVTGLPSFSVYTDELELNRDRGAIMRALASISDEKEYGNGVRFRYKDGWVTVAPRSGVSSIRIISESMSMEAAKEICADIKTRAAEADSETD